MEGPFHQLDRVRRLQGRALDALGLGPTEAPWEEAGRWPGVRLRDYGGPAGGDALLVVPAPIKRAYLWDLAPHASAVRRFLEADLRVHLAEWTRPGPGDRHLGLDEVAGGLVGRCVDEVRARSGQDAVALTGHSLGGTFAAIFAARHPERVSALALFEAPLRFGGAAGAFAPLVAAAPHAGVLRERTATVPGTLLNLASTLAAPVTFVAEREADLVASLTHARALDTHLRVRRWQLDELPLPERLFEDVVERLYRRDELMRGELLVGGERVSPARVRAPLLSVVNPGSRLVPEGSVLPFHEAVSSTEQRVLHYRGERGVALQHVGSLVGEDAHRRLWPELLAWLRDVLARQGGG
ncbi:MAG: alpha/beta fold hydrolase [Actinomycetota bacterium]|nr:alpha/beta fold hydrolase [Actinomycetota bacterium]